MSAFRFTSLVESLPESVPFVGPETQERAMGRPFLARLGANESVFGPSPRAVEAMRASAADAWMYGDAESFDLKAALAERHDVDPAALVIGEGIDGLLGSIARLFVEQGDPVVTSDGAYPTFAYHVAGYGGRLHKVPYLDDCEDPAGLIAKAHQVQAKLIYIANPDNPMGTWHNAATMQSMIDEVPKGTLLVLDEAYGEFAPEGTAPVLDASDRRVIRMRTFSKAYGMAGARVGYAICHPDLARAFNKVRNHFGMGRISQIGALAALGDTGWLNEVRGKVAASRDEIARIARTAGLAPLASATNFVTMDCGRDGDFARRLVAALGREGIFVRMPFVSPQDRCIRVSCGTAADLAALEAALPRALSVAADTK